MDENKVVSPEEAQAEAAALAVAKEDEIREGVIEEFGFNEIDDAERIEKAVKKELENRQRLSKAIEQKIKYRELATKPKTDAPSVKAPEPEDFDKKLEEKLTARLEKQALDEMEYPDELKAEISKLAKLNGISVKQAARDPYIAFQVKEYEKAQRADEAAISRTNRSSGSSKFSVDTPPEVDMSTAEGRAKWDEYKAFLKKQGL